MSVEEHKSHAPISVSCFVLTVSDTRTEANDTGGQTIRDLLETSGHTIAGHAIVRDDPDAVTRTVSGCLADPTTQVIVTTGGTGITSRDGTYEAIDRLLEKRLTGFGELFRMLSYAEVGAAAMLSRAQGGVVQGRALFSLPGSPNACRLALEKLIVPELGRVLREVRR